MMSQTMNVNPVLSLALIVKIIQISVQSVKKDSTYTIINAYKTVQMNFMKTKKKKNVRIVKILVSVVE
jgi:hypothetical protein